MDRFNISSAVAGRGDPVILVHGGPGLRDYLAPLAQELASAYTVITYQQRGVAPSIKVGPYSVKQHVEDAISVIVRESSEPVLLLGHSWGAHLAMHIATASPELIRGMVLIEPLGITSDGGYSALTQNRLSRLSLYDRKRVLALRARFADRSATHTEVAEMLDRMWPTNFAAQSTIPPSPEWDMSSECNVRTMESVYAEILEGTLVSRLGDLTLECLVLLGRESPLPLEVGTEVAAVLRNSELLVAANAGHFPWLEREGLVTRALSLLSQ